jgi:hypothetical protein
VFASPPPFYIYSSASNIYVRPQSIMDDSQVYYDAYDLSEFTAADFVHIDSATREHDPDPDATGDRGASRRVEETSGSGGPQIAVALELAADEFVVVKVGGSGSGDDAVDAAQNEGKLDRGTLGDPFNAANSRSPYEMHRSGGYLSVSDLVRPSWYAQVPSPLGRL